jgi:DNA helicase-4
MTHLSETTKLIDVLIEHWRFWELHENFYITKLAPSLVADPSKGDNLERDILTKLRQVLTPDEWQAIPSLITERRADILREIESERLRREMQERERQEAERITAQKRQEAERIAAQKRQEAERLAAERREAEARERIRQEQIRKQAEEHRSAMLHELRRRFNSDFLSATPFFLEACASLLTEQEFEDEKCSFIKTWIKANNLKLPDNEQIAAISAVNGHVQVVARAGSGKTTTLVNRVFFLLKHCRIAPTEMLILAFNRKAALEIRRRLLVLIDQNAESEIAAEVKRRIKDARKRQYINRDEIEAGAVEAIASQLKITLPHVMTFHALAYAIVHPEESLLYNGSEGESQGLSRVFQQVIDDHLMEPEFREKIRRLMLAHFREDWDRIVGGRYDQSRDEFLRFRRSLPRESLRGDYVKSYGEKIIANFLFEHDIAYKYERNHWWSGINYRPDFTIFVTPKSGLIIEYFGLSGDLDYDEMSERKREYWKTKLGWTLIEFSPKDITNEGTGAFLERLKTTLIDQNIQCARLSEDEIWNRVHDRAIDRFTTVSVGFVSRCRKQSLSPIELLEKIKRYSSLSSVEDMFLGLVYSLYNAYLNRLSSTGEEDFDGLMQRAAQAVEDGIAKFHRKSGVGNLASLRYICIDEFQDFSDLFYRLILAIRKVSPQVELFCVGDDWQAINGFAGSDLRFFNEFERYVGKSRRLYISTNYRSAKSIVAVGNALMSGLGETASASKEAVGKVLVSDLNKFEPSLIEKQRHPGDIITPAVLRLVNSALTAGIDVVMLCRRNGLPWFINYQDQSAGGSQSLARYLDLVRSFFPIGLRERISISTAHKYKGLEKSMVIVLDLVARSYPLIHPDWTFSRILGDSLKKIAEEERRLLYVALTRAADTVVVFTEDKNKSIFLEELERKINLAAVEWADYPPLRGPTTRLVVKVGNQERRGGSPTFAIKDLLKASGYQWQSNGWAKSFPAEGFKTEILKSEVWSKTANGIDVCIFDDTDAAVARFLVDGGFWICMFDNLKSLYEPFESGWQAG